MKSEDYKEIIRICSKIKNSRYINAFFKIYFDYKNFDITKLRRRIKFVDFVKKGKAPSSFTSLKFELLREEAYSEKAELAGLPLFY